MTLDDVRFEFECAPAPETYHYPGGATIESGTAASQCLRLTGEVAGQPLLIAEHITRMHPDVAPDWPQPSSGIGSYRVVVEGSPRDELAFSMSGVDGSAMSGGLALTALRASNAIPAVHAAAPGLLSALDVLSVTGRGRVSRGASSV